jgi:glycosyltransferase involved in cell wall biosynthesis
LKTAIVIPAYNEAKTISFVVKGVKPYVDIVIVVDDASTDETRALALSEGAVVVKHLYNRGYDNALQTGFEKASDLNAEIVVTFDADGQHNASIIKSFIDPIESGNADIVLGLRKKTARFSEFIFNLYGKMRYGTSDLLCGLKAYNMSVYYRHGCFSSFDSIGTELTLFGLCNKIPTITVEIDINKNIRKSQFGTVISSNIKIIKALINVIWIDIKNNCK